VEGVGNVAQVAGVEASDGDTAVSGHVDGVLLAEFVNHGLGEAGVGEHTDLVDDVVPVVFGAEVCHVLVKTVTHFVHAAGHHSQVVVPAGGKLGVTKHDVDDAGTVDGGVGVKTTCEVLDAGHADFLLSGVGSDEGNAASTLTVKTEVLGERLEEHQVVDVRGEESKRVGILLEVTGGEALVGRVEGNEVVLALDNVENVVPLLVGGVNTSGVVGAHVHEEDGAVLGVLQVLLEACVVEALGLGVVVSVFLELSADEADETLVKGPGGGGHVDGGVLGVPVVKELHAESEGASSGDGLSGGNTAFLKSLVVSTVSEGHALGDVGVNTLDTSVLVVHVQVENSLFGLADTVEDEGLALIATVNAHTQEVLVGVGVLLESIV